MVFPVIAMVLDPAENKIQLNYWKLNDFIDRAIALWHLERYHDVRGCVVGEWLGRSV